MTTSWIFEMIDRITAPMRNVTKGADAMGDAIDNVQERVKLSEKGTKIALERESKARKEVQAQIKKTEKELKELEKQQKKQTGEEFQKTANEIKRAQKNLEDYRKELEGIEKDLEDLSDDMDVYVSKHQKWNDIATGANQLSDMLDRVAGSLDFADEINQTQNSLQRMTGMTGNALEDLTGDVHRLAAEWRATDEEIARSTNAMVKGFGISYEKALDLINQGYEKGANLNGDMLEQMREYPVQMRELGISAEQFVALMAQAGRDGIFSDKAIDSIKEANLSLKEMGQAQIDALTGIGLKVSDLAGKTTLEAVQMVSKAMEGASTQAKQLALTDIFKGAGEDAGMSFIVGLSSVDMNIDNIPSVQEAGAGIRGFMADVESWIATSLGGATQYIQTFTYAAVGINSVIGIINTLKATQIAQSVASGVATAAQWAWNAALTANPIGVVIMAVAALVGGIVLLANKFSWANGIVEAVKSSWKDWGKVILDFVVMPLKMAWGALEGIWKLLQGDWSGAMQSFSAPIDGIVNDIGAAAANTATGYQRGYADKEAKNAAEQQERNRKAFGLDEFGQGRSTGPDSQFDRTKLDGRIAPPGGKPKSPKGAKTSDGLSVSGTAGRSISMNLTVHNHFNGKVSSGVDVDGLAEKVTEKIVDQVRDILLTA